VLDGVSLLPVRRLSPFVAGFLGACCGVGFMASLGVAVSSLAALASAAGS